MGHLGRLSHEAFILKGRGQVFDSLTASQALRRLVLSSLGCSEPHRVGGLPGKLLPSNPVLSLLQGQELTIRQISLLGFRDLVLLKVKLGDLLLLAQAQLPSSIVQMLLILQVRPQWRRDPKAKRRKEGKRPPL